MLSEDECSEQPTLAGHKAPVACGARGEVAPPPLPALRTTGLNATDGALLFLLFLLLLVEDLGD